MSERHLSPKEVAERWGLSPDTIRSLFSLEPGVIRFGGGSRTTLRIPESVVERVRTRLSAAPYQGESHAVSKHYAPWVKERQEQLEEDVRKTFKRKVVPMRKKAG